MREVLGDVVYRNLVIWRSSGGLRSGPVVGIRSWLPGEMGSGLFGELEGEGGGLYAMYYCLCRFLNVEKFLGVLAPMDFKSTVLFSCFLSMALG